MKRTIVMVALLLGTTLSASAMQFNFTDVARPRGHDRSDWALQRATHYCDWRVGVQEHYMSQDYASCMLSRGWRYDSAQPEQPFEAYGDYRD